MATLAFDLKYAASDTEALLARALRARGLALQRGQHPDEWLLQLHAVEIVVQLVPRSDGMTHIVLRCDGPPNVLSEVMDALNEELEVQAREVFSEQAETYRERAIY